MLIKVEQALIEYSGMIIRHASGILVNIPSTVFPDGHEHPATEW